jgi:hypothetical protein
MVRRGEPGTAAVHKASGSLSIRKIVVLLLVHQAFRRLSRNAGDDWG